MPTLTPTATGSSTKTVVAFTLLGSVAIAAMIFFGFSAQKQTPDRTSVTERQDRLQNEAPVVEEAKSIPNTNQN
jgi:hypothetical protein